MDKKILYMGNNEFKLAAIELTGNQNSYIIEATSVGSAKILLQRIQIDQILIEYKKYDREIIEFNDFLKRDEYFNLIPLIFFKVDPLGIDIVFDPQI